MKRANKINSCAAIIIGENELSRNKGLIRNMDSGEQIEICLDDLDKYFKTNAKSLK